MYLLTYVFIYLLTHILTSATIVCCYRYVYYCMKYINNLLSFGIKPIMVFDGCRLPSKQEVEKTRRECVCLHHHFLITLLVLFALSI